MVTRMLIDATHSEETRVVVLNGTRLEDFDFESSTKKQIKSNIYLAKVTRVEPSLQAAFIEYGGNRHGFLSFSEIHPDYYRIPLADREALMAETAAEEHAPREPGEATEPGQEVETLGGDEFEEAPVRRSRSAKQYKIQDVIVRRQIMLVQVVKEERGTKGAALTTFLSLAGRYCVLMPNTPRGGGVSRKITSVADRKRLKSILDEFDLPDGMAVIVRTAGMERAKPEIKRDFEYLLRLWDDIRELTMKSSAPALIYEEGSLIKRSIRDLYTRDIDEVLVEGEEGYKTAKAFMKMIVPSHARRVKPYRDPAIPMMFRYQVEAQIDAIHSPTVQLKSGGSIVINPTEALVAIDVNSGRATRERHIEETAIKTNLEAADEIARQVRLRDLAGLIVIDFIDMEDSRNNHAVERRIKEAMKNDRARIQIGRISPFGLLELSRQRLRPSLIETSTETCPRCHGTGTVRSTESTALHVLRALEEEGIGGKSAEINLFVPTSVALYVLNQKRHALNEIELKYSIQVMIDADDTLTPPDYRLERTRLRAPGEVVHLPTAPIIHDVEDEDDIEEEEIVETHEAEESAAGGDEEGASEGTNADGSPKKRRRGRRRRGRRPDEAAAQAPRDTESVSAEASESEEGEEEGAEGVAAAPGSDDDSSPKRRRRGRRGGRRRNRGRPGEENLAAQTTFSDSGEPVYDWPRQQFEEPVVIAAEIVAEPVVAAPEPVIIPITVVEPPPPAPKAAPEIVVEPVIVAPEPAPEPAKAAEPNGDAQSHAEPPAPNPAIDVVVVDRPPENPKRGWWGKLTR